MSDNLPCTRIKKLSPLLINQLAAGEVVTRPAAVVKELLENAIDAGATYIEVRITQGGMGLIEVADNGCGIHPDDMVMAITRHATSKVADVANLQGISTLGFRGEALSAMAAVSRLTLISSHNDSGIGRQLQVAGILADNPKLTPVVHHQGTTVTVKDLYFNVPARRGNLKSIATEFNHIETIVREVALARSDVTLNLYHEDKQRLSLSAIATDLARLNQNSNGSIVGAAIDHRLSLARLEQALGMNLTDNALDIAIDLSSLMQTSIDTGSSLSPSFSEQSAHISGWLWPMNRNRSQTAHPALPKLLYVNGRLIKEVVISTQLRKLAQSAQFDTMGYALYFELPPQWLNVNVHPSKQRIKISPLNNIMAHLSHTLRLKLKALEVIAPVIGDAAIADADNAITTAKNATTQHLNQEVAYNPAYQPLSKNGFVSQALAQGQVQSPKRPYQKHTAAHSINNEILNSTTPLNSTNSLSNSNLPQCLEVITSLPDITLSTAKPPLNAASLPWLLFYHQSQCWLISAQIWHSSLAQLFDAQLFDKQALDKPSALTDASLHNKQFVNQQLITISQQMSAPDGLVFITAIETLLTKNALITIDSAQLVALMLSSASL